MSSIRVVLADDHHLVRAGFGELLRRLTGIQVVGEASNGYEALDLIASQRPDVVLMDIGMADLNGLEATTRAVKAYPGVRVLILSMHTDKEYVLKALRAGAAGYLLKDADIAQLELAVRAVAGGETYLSPSVSTHVIADYVRRVGSAPCSPDELTPRQREILQLIAEGHSKQDIARKLNISLKTVETHRDQLKDRLGIYDIAGLVRYAVRSGIVSADQ